MFANYHEAVVYLGSKADRPYSHGRATRVIRIEREEGNSIGIRYHDTVVAEYTESGVILNSGGWRTATTKERINDALRRNLCAPRVYQDKGVWYLGSFHRGDNTIKPVVFFDGIQIDYAGNILNLPNQRENEARIAEVKRLTKLIKAYSAEVKNQIETLTLPAPSGGDCWDCYLHEVETGKPLGDLKNDNAHLISHLEELYIVPSLIVNAVKTVPHSLILESALGGLWRKDDNVIQGRFYIDILARDLPRIVARYLKLKLAIADR